MGVFIASWRDVWKTSKFCYRPINNWILNKLQFSRNSKINADFFKKGRAAAIGMANKLKKGEVIGLTNDQILREGIMVPFLEKTPTPQAAAIMSLKWNVPIFMVRVERLNLLNFKLTIEDEIKLPKSIKNDNAVYKLTELISKRTEQWIIEKPEQWLWAHRRWGNNYLIFKCYFSYSINKLNFTFLIAFCIIIFFYYIIFIIKHYSKSLF